MYIVGQHLTYLYKQAGEDFTVDATVIDTSPDGKEVTVEFVHPGGKRHEGGYKHRRTLLFPRDRKRIVSQEIEQQTNWGGPRPNAGRKPKKGRQRLELDPDAARNLYLLTKYRRALFGNPALTEEQVVTALVEDEWKAIQREMEPAEELQEPYIV